MSRAGLIVLFIAGAVPTLFAGLWTHSAAQRLAATQSGNDEVAIASATDAGYCSPDLKKILRRVLQSCGLVGRSGARGCQPLQAKSVASLPSDDFNALFQPMRSRGGIVQFDRDATSLDTPDHELIDSVFSDQRGASYFFVVARASPEGTIEHNRKLSQDRAESVLSYLREHFKDPDLDSEVGLLWLGEEFAQLDSEFCEWRRSVAGPDAAAACNTTDLNRGAFISWIDCRL